jgi:hypothetical protein
VWSYGVLDGCRNLCFSEPGGRNATRVTDTFHGKIAGSISAPMFARQCTFHKLHTTLSENPTISFICRILA